MNDQAGPPSMASLSEGLRLEDLRALREIVEREIFRTTSRLNEARGLNRQEQAQRVSKLDGLRSRIDKEIRWAQQAGVPADRLRQLFPQLVKAARLATREEYGIVDITDLTGVLMQVDAAMRSDAPTQPL